MKRTLITLLALALTGCAAFTVHVKPLPAGAKPCGSDWDCPSSMWCGFPGVDTRPQCLPGHGEERWDH